jgi:hypothetical protein
MLPGPLLEVRSSGTGVGLLEGPDDPEPEEPEGPEVEPDVLSSEPLPEDPDVPEDPDDPDVLSSEPESVPDEPLWSST